MARGGTLEVRLTGPVPGGPGRTWTYGLAGQQVAIDRPVEMLEAWLDLAARKRVTDAAPLPEEIGTGGRFVYGGLAKVGEAWREVRCTRVAGGYGLDFAGAGRFTVPEAGTPIALVEQAADAADGAVEEALIGPILILALALRGTWCLHASAATVADRAVAFVGESGRGKSTLAGFLGAGGGWLADDILPVTVESVGLTAAPRFPQLKVPIEAQAASLIPERVALSALYVLAAAEPSGQPVVRPLGRREATLALVRHTVAARLFEGRLLARHLGFCAEAAARVPVRRLEVPRRREALSRVRECLATDLGSVGRG